ncbi:DUF3383 family protein [Weissella sp. MSCH1]|uniref:DUF3383 family protein n=1 Tax=Weissella sp. MSCH1 TaxID=3383343 RepID=UPI003896A60D
MAVSDVTVTMTVNQPTQTLGFGVPAVWVPGTDNSYKEYKTIDDVLADFAKTTLVYKNAAAFFGQQGHPGVFSVITYKDMAAAYELYSGKPWYFALFGGDAETAGQDILLLSNLIEAEQYRMMFVELNYAKSDDGSTFSNEQYAENTRTILIVKQSETDTATDAEAFAANLIGTYGGRTVGSLNFHDLVVPGLTPDNWTGVQVSKFDRGNAMLYVLKANNVAQTTSGRTAAGDYIDVIMGMDWVASEVRSELQDLLTNTDKVTYDAAGIALMQSVVDNVMQTAYTNGIIDINDETQAPDYSVTALGRNELAAGDIQNRAYNGLSYEYRPSGAVNTINIRGTIQL